MLTKQATKHSAVIKGIAALILILAVGNGFQAFSATKVLTVNSSTYTVGEQTVYVVKGAPANTAILWSSWQGNRILRAENFEQVGFVKGCSQSFDLDASFVGFLATEQVHCQSSQGAQIFCGVADSDSAVVFAEDHVQHPMAGVFDSPVRADRVAKALSFDR